MKTNLLLLLALLACGCASPPRQAGSAAAAGGEEFNANFTNIGNVGVTGATPVVIRIRRWSSEDEHAQLMKVLEQDGTAGFVRLLREMKTTGSIGVPQELAYPLLYARQVRRPDGGRRITLATDRPMSFEERLNAPVSRDYPLSWIEINLGPDDRGEGTMVLAARLRLLGNVLGIEDLGNQPARLTAIRKVR